MSSHGSKRAEMHHYLKGYNFWNTNRVWRKKGNGITNPPEFIKDSDDWVDSLQQNTRSLAAIDKTLK